MASRENVLRCICTWDTGSCHRGNSDIVPRLFQVAPDAPGPFLFVLFFALFRLLSLMESGRSLLPDSMLARGKAFSFPCRNRSSEYRNRRRIRLHRIETKPLRECGQLPGNAISAVMDYADFVPTRLEFPLDDISSKNGVIKNFFREIDCKAQ